MVGTGALDAQQTQANVQARTMSRGKCPCFGGPTKMVGVGGGVMGSAAQGNTATYQTSQPYEVQQVASGLYVMTNPVVQAPTTQVVSEAPQPQGDLLITTQELHPPISLADEARPVTQTVPRTYTAAPPSAIVSMPPSMACAQPLQPAAAVPTATYAARPASMTYAAQAPARTLYPATQVTNPTIMSQGLVSPVPSATVHSPYAQMTTSPFTYTPTAPAQLSPMSVQTPTSTASAQLSPVSVQAPTYTAGSVASMPYREGTGQSGLVRMGSAMARPGQAMREPTLGGPAVYLGQPSSSAVINTAGTTAASAYAPTSTLPLMTTGPSSLVNQVGGGGTGMLAQTYDGSFASGLSRALLSVQGPMANTRAFQKEVSRLAESSQ